MSNKKQNYKTKGIGSGVLAFGAVFALYSAIFKPHSIGSIVLALALSGFVGAIIRIMAQGLDTTQNQKTPESLQKRVMEQAEWQILPQAIDMIANGRI